ncbi:MAG: beta-ketoacyl synthase N-terminal-like domain-containing protein, partial [Vicinamibacterales bacterium]
INKACAGGMQAVASGAQSILLGESDVVLAGGIENMSRVPYLVMLPMPAGATRWATSSSSTPCIATASRIRCRA